MGGKTRKIFVQLISQQNKLQVFVVRFTVTLGSIVCSCLGNEPLELDRTRDPSRRNGAYQFAKYFGQKLGHSLKDTSFPGIQFHFAAFEPELLSFPSRILSVPLYAVSEYPNHHRTTSWRSEENKIRKITSKPPFSFISSSGKRKLLFSWPAPPVCVFSTS